MMVEEDADNTVPPHKSGGKTAAATIRTAIIALNRNGIWPVVLSFPKL